jgi:hypothetical protein
MTVVCQNISDINQMECFQMNDSGYRQLLLLTMISMIG